MSTTTLRHITQQQGHTTQQLQFSTFNFSVKSPFKQFPAMLHYGTIIAGKKAP